VKLETAAHRRARRGASQELFESEERQRRVIRQYAAAVRRLEKRERIVSINGNRPSDEVASEVLEVIRSDLRKIARVGLR